MITTKEIQAAKPREKPYKLFDSHGLYLEIRPNNARYWRLKYRYGGVEKRLALGVYKVRGGVSLKKAREKADAARELLANNIDPAAVRRAEKAACADTFEVVGREWLQMQKQKLYSITLKQAETRLRQHAFRYFGKRPIREVTPADILEAVKRLEKRGHHETAHRVLGRISQVFRYAVASGKAVSDPTRDLRGALAPVPTQHRAAITDPKRVGELLRSIDHYIGQRVTVAALQLIALTFVRPGELRQARWGEFDFDSAQWVVPAKRMKMKREHVVPLSSQSIDILQELHAMTYRDDDSLVFPALRPGRCLSENTINLALRNMGYDGDTMTGHGFRATASTLLHELGYPPEVIELQLAHAQRSQVAAAYNRSARLKERVSMLQQWADYCDQLKSGAEVVPIHHKVKA